MEPVLAYALNLVRLDVLAVLEDVLADVTDVPVLAVQGVPLDAEPHALVALGALGVKDAHLVVVVVLGVADAEAHVLVVLENVVVALGIVQ